MLAAALNGFFEYRGSCDHLPGAEDVCKIHRISVYVFVIDRSGRVRI